MHLTIGIQYITCLCYLCFLFLFTGILMKETGISVVVTSINNIIAFMAGTLLPIPALKSFCSQVKLSIDRLLD